MTTAALHIKQSNWKQWTKRISIAFVLAIVAVTVLTIISIVTVSSQVGLGNLISEKVLGRDGVVPSSLLLGRTGTNIELSIMGFAPVTSTMPITTYNDTGEILSVTLSGRVTSMNGMPVATGYFLWGLAPGALVNTTATFPIAGIGDYTSGVIGGLNPNDPIYYQLVTDADGTAYGAVTRFLVPSGVGGFLIKNLLRVILAGVILVGVIRFGMGNPMRMLLLSAVGILGFAIISSFIETLF
jgi:hypothetical protein